MVYIDPTAMLEWNDISWSPTA